ncbi:MAG: transglycosylase domain-containing protein [Candidatus Sungbacteria bacterium]|uniref:Transglycosylase domain-containing protein n=1 Tax=Candidatus Sungiibacteriota bacterium TaxID=2750080 RepID=A0A9D6LTG6_9BACT|nr:transglycosylase domain-containing protein [Candidatus Sungbacteria bacterium]
MRRRRRMLGVNSWKKLIWIIVGTAGGLLLGGGVSIYLVLAGVPDPTRLEDRKIAQSTRIMDRTSTVVLYDIHGEEKRTVIPFDQIPDSVKKATVAIEDERFYSHGGVDIRGMLRALLVDITSGSLREGGSTITQQFVKGALLKPDRSIVRKIREAIIAIILESRYSKDEILGFYLNQIPYGANAYGIEAAAQTYFGKSARNLDPAESALLAALPQAPSYYSPFGSHRDELLKRKDVVLDHMVDLGFISKPDAAAAKKEVLEIKKAKQDILAPHFVNYIREYLAQTYGEETVEQGGLTVITTLNWDLQQKAEEVVQNGALRNDNLIDAKNSALVAMDPKTGEILAMVGSRDYFSDPLPKGCTPGLNCQLDPQVNVTIKPRQPGSAFKPFVYATALLKGYTDKTVLFDVPTEFNAICNPDGTAPAGYDPRNCYMPGNYDEKFRGPVVVRNALAESLNVPSVELLYLAGVENSIKTANAMGITTIQYDPARYGLALVLGGAEVTLLDMVHGYGGFARDGVQANLTGIIKITDANGTVLEAEHIKTSEIIDPEVARMINDILSDNNARQPIFAPQSSLYFPDRQVAAKTGTTQDYRDAWTIGYTPSLVVGVWSGNNNNKPMKQKGSGVLASAPIFHAFFEAALAGSPPEQFTKPAPVQTDKPILSGLWRGGQVIVIDRLSGKLATADTPEELRQQITAGEPHTILYWVDKDNPRGPVPQNPAADPEYSHWEYALNRWLQVNPIGPPSIVPTEFDPLHTGATKPQLQILFPKAGDVIQKGSAIHVNLTFSVKFPIQEITFLVNDKIEKSLTFGASPIAIEIPTDDLDAGEIELKIRIRDVVENSNEVTIPILLTP